MVAYTGNDHLTHRSYQLSPSAHNLRPFVCKDMIKIGARCKRKALAWEKVTKVSNLRALAPPFRLHAIARSAEEPLKLAVLSGWSDQS